MANGGKVTTVVHRSGDQGQTIEPGLPEMAGQQPAQGGGFMGWVSQHKMLVAVVLGGGGLLLLWWFYNQGQASQGATDQTGTTDTTGTTTSDGSTAGLGTSGYGAPDWSPVVGAITGLQQQEQTDTQSVLQAIQANQAAQAQQQATTQFAPPGTGITSGPSSPSWQPQTLGATPGLSNQQEALKQYNGCVANCRATVTECKGKKKGSASCKAWCEQKCAARHPIPSGGGYFRGGSSMSLRSMHMQEPHWRSTYHQGIHLGREI